MGSRDKTRKILLNVFHKKVSRIPEIKIHNSVVPFVTKHSFQ